MNIEQVFGNAGPYYIAEMSGNHNKSLDRAKEIILSAKQTGASAIKIQTYTADTITIDCDNEEFLINDKDSLWDGRKLYDLYSEASTPWEWHKELFDYAKEQGILLFSSPFDKTAVDFLEELGNPIYKIASFELVDIPLIEYVAKTGKPIIMSTGVATLGEITDAVSAAKRAGAEDITLLHCISSYPASAAKSNLKTINALKELFNVRVGLSDHSLGIGVPVASMAFDTDVIEKHYTLDKADGGVDSAFSLDPDEFKEMIVECEKARKAHGEVHFRFERSENYKQRQFSRSLYIVKDIQEGEVFTEEYVRSIRPGYGMAPKYLGKILGKKANRDISKGTPMNWKYVKIESEN